MTSDATRIETSAGVAAAIHASLFGLYLLLKVTEPVQETVKLTRVDFIDQIPKAAASSTPSPGRLERAPKSFKDFLHMALPSFHAPSPSQPKLAEMQNEPTPNSPQANLTSPQIQLKTSARPLNKNFRFKPTHFNAKDSTRLSDVSTPQIAPQESPQDMPNVKPITLEAVGRVKASGQIHFNSAAHFKSSGQMRDLPQENLASAGAASLADSQPPSIRLNASYHGSKSAALPTGGELPIGYEKGISLKEGAVHPAGANLPQVSAASAQVKTGKLKSVHHKGMEISGPLADRKILKATAPEYPAWAKNQGVEADVVVRFYVSADGHVLDRMIIERTSGYHRLDELCKKTLKKMLFAPLESGDQVEWGFITFHFKLK